MKIARDCTPIDIVSKEAYERELPKALKLSSLYPGEEYTMRAIQDDSSEDSYGADFLVLVNEIIRPRKRRLNWFADRVIQISLSAVDLDTNEISEEQDIQLIRENGTTYTRNYAFLFSPLYFTTGYFLGNEDTFSEDLLAITTSPLDNPGIPSLV